MYAYTCIYIYWWIGIIYWSILSNTQWPAPEGAIVRTLESKSRIFRVGSSQCKMIFKWIGTLLSKKRAIGGNGSAGTSSHRWPNPNGFLTERIRKVSVIGDPQLPRDIFVTVFAFWASPSIESKGPDGWSGAAPALQLQSICFGKAPHALPRHTARVSGWCVSLPNRWEMPPLSCAFGGFLKWGVSGIHNPSAIVHEINHLAIGVPPWPKFLWKFSSLTAQGLRPGVSNICEKWGVP